MIARRLSIVGVGLIGGSLARALRAADEVEIISAWDRDAEQLKRALELNVIDHGARDAVSAVAGAEIVVLAVPVLETASVLKMVEPELSGEAVVTDVGSTKCSVIDNIRTQLGNVPSTFVPGHPIAGTEKNGVAASTADLFAGHRVILTPHAEMDERAARRIEQMWKAVGATVERMSPERHDEILAAISHLPHLLAYALIESLSQSDLRPELFRYAAGGFRDFTRIAGSSPQMWHDILLANRNSIIPLVDQYIATLGSIRNAVVADDHQYILEFLQRARDGREQFVMPTQIDQPPSGKDPVS